MPQHRTTSGYHVHADRLVGVALQDARTHGRDGLERSRELELARPPGAICCGKTAEPRGSSSTRSIGDSGERMGGICRCCIMAIGCLLGWSAPAEAQGSGDSSTEVASLVTRYDSAWNRKDTLAAGRLMAPEYRYFSSLGGVRPRAAMLEFLGSPDYHLRRADRSELQITRSGPVVVVSSRWKGQGTYQGKRFADDQRCGLVWVRTTRTWRLVSEHCVQIAPDPWATGDGEASAPRVTNLAGARDRAGLFAQRLLLPAQFCGPLHIHDRDLHGLVLRGILRMGLTDTTGNVEMRSYPAGSFVPVPAGKPHVEGSLGETEIHLTGIGPVRTIVVDSTTRQSCQ
jgi:ketosteroid isomerase-like protein